LLQNTQPLAGRSSSDERQRPSRSYTLSRYCFLKVREHKCESRLARTCGDTLNCDELRSFILIPLGWIEAQPVGHRTATFGTPTSTALELAAASPDWRRSRPSPHPAAVSNRMMARRRDAAVPPRPARCRTLHLRTFDAGGTREHSMPGDALRWSARHIRATWIASMAMTESDSSRASEK
jgi:hypothetical protein